MVNKVSSDRFLCFVVRLTKHACSLSLITVVSLSVNKQSVKLWVFDLLKQQSKSLAQSNPNQPINYLQLIFSHLFNSQNSSLQNLKVDYIIVVQVYEDRRGKVPNLPSVGVSKCLFRVWYLSICQKKCIAHRSLTQEKWSQGAMGVKHNLFLYSEFVGLLLLLCPHLGTQRSQNSQFQFQLR